MQAISAATITQISPSSLHEVVRYFAALTPGRAFTTQVADFSSRGVGTSVREDGLPLLRVSVPLEDFSRVELLQGVGDATQAGDKSPGGILNFVSKTPGPEAFAHLNLVGNDHGNVLSQADLNLPLDGRTGLRLNVGLERFRFANDTKGSRQSVILAGRHEFAPGVVLDLHGYYTSTPLRQNFYGYFPLDPDTGRPPPLSYGRRYGQRWARNNFRTGLIAGRLTADLGGGWSVQAGGNYYKVTERSIETTLASPVAANGTTQIGTFRTDQDFPGAGLRGSLVKEIWWGEAVVNRAALIADHTWYDERYGGARATSGDVNFFTSIDVPKPIFGPTKPYLDSRVLVTGYAFQDELTLFDRLTVSAGVKRYILDQKSFDGAVTGAQIGSTALRNWLPNYSALFKITPRLSIYASSFLAIEPGQFVNTGYINAGEQLPPLRSRTIEAGVKYQAGPLVASFSAFRFRRPSEFDVPATDADGNPGFRKEQGGSTRYQGLDASLTGRVLPHLTVIASAALVDTKILESDTPSFVGQQLASTPKYTAALFAEDEFLRGWFVAGGVKYSSAQQVDQTGVFQVPGYTLFDAGLRHETTFNGAPVHVGLFAENLANKLYFPGTSYQSVQLGGPRTIKLSVGADF